MVIKQEKNIINILIPTGFNSDLKIITGVINELNALAYKTLIVDTNPCRSLYESNWDYLCKELLGGKVSLNMIPYLEKQRYYYLKPFNSFKDYYLNSNLYPRVIDSLSDVEGVDYIFLLHYLNDYQVSEEILERSNFNFILTYGENSMESFKGIDSIENYRMKYLEARNPSLTDVGQRMVSSENIWDLLKLHYKDFELSIFDEVNI